MCQILKSQRYADGVGDVSLGLPTPGGYPMTDPSYHRTTTRFRTGRRHKKSQEAGRLPARFLNRVAVQIPRGTGPGVAAAAATPG